MSDDAESAILSELLLAESRERAAEAEERKQFAEKFDALAKAVTALGVPELTQKVDALIKQFASFKELPLSLPPAPKASKKSRLVDFTVTGRDDNGYIENATIRLG